MPFFSGYGYWNPAPNERRGLLAKLKHQMGSKSHGESSLYKKRYGGGSSKKTMKPISSSKGKSYGR